jgi:hypothetical protein
VSIDHDAILEAIDFAKENAYGSDEASDLGKKRAKNIEYYLGLNTNPAPEGRSQVVDRSVYETIQVMLPSLVRIFAGSSDEICKAVAIGPDDEAGAEQTTAVLRHYVTEKNNWEQICADWIFDALVSMNGYCMAYWDESKRLIREEYEGQSDEQLASLMQDKAVHVLQHSQTVDEQATEEAQLAYQQAAAQYQQMAQAAQAQAQQTGQPPRLPPPPQPPQPVLKHDLVIERQENEGKVCIRVLAPEHCTVSSDTPNWMLDECPYFEYREQKTISDLRAMGLEVDEDVSDDEDRSENEESMARDRFGENRDEANKGVMRLVWARMVWVKADAEGDEQSRLYYAIIVGRTVLFAQPCARIPVASMTPQPLPHRHIGMSAAETVTDIQDIKQAVKRGGLDNLYLNINGRSAVSSKVNLEDMLDSRPGGVIRMIDDSLPAEGHFLPVEHPFAFDKIIGSLEYFDQERQNRSGAMRGAAGLEANAMNRAAVGTTVAMQSHSAMRTEHVARMMSPAVEALFSAVWEIISKHANKALSLKLKGQWTLVNPQAWRTKRDIKISVGVGAGNKEQMMQELRMQLAAQMQIGLPLGLCTRKEIHETCVEIAKLAGFANPMRFWPDPTNLPPPQPPTPPEMIKAQADIQIAQMKGQSDIQKFQAEQMGKLRELEAAHAAKVRELQAQLALQATNDQRDHEREQQKAAIQAQIDMAKEQNKKEIADLQAAVEKYKADLQAQVQMATAQMAAPPQIDISPVQKSIEDLSKYLQSPAEIVRDKDTGRAIGVKKGETTRMIKRDADGRPQGLQ